MSTFDTFLYDTFVYDKSLSPPAGLIGVWTYDEMVVQTISYDEEVEVIISYE